MLLHCPAVNKCGGGDERVLCPHRLWPLHQLFMNSCASPWSAVELSALVRQSAWLHSELICCALIASPCWCSLTKWHANASAFLFKVLAGFVTLRRTLLLSTKILVFLETSTPIAQRWCLNVITTSTAFFIAMNSAPNVLVWTAVCLVDFQCAGVHPTNARTPVMLLPVTKSCP